MTRNNQQTIGGELMQRATLFVLTQHAWRNKGKGNMDEVQTSADKDRCGLALKLIECEEYDALRSFMDERKTWVKSMCLPSFIRPGVFIVDLGLVDRFEEELTRANRKIERELVPALLEVYAKRVESAEKELGSQFDKRKYPKPSDLATRFSLEWGWIAFGVPENLPTGLRKKEAAKLTKAYEDAQKQMVTALRVGFSEIVNRAVERLTVKPGEKPATFRDSLIDNFREFFDSFQYRNLMRDAELAAIVKKAKNIVDAADPGLLRRRLSIRKATAERLTDVKKALDTIISSKPSRGFDFDGE